MSVEVVLTFPGRLGDAIHQWGVAHHWLKSYRKPVTVWLDQGSCGPLQPLLESQPYVEKVEMKSGIVSYACGGQPWHFDLGTSEHQGRVFHHLGLRRFPQRQLTFECQEQANLGVKMGPEAVAEPFFDLPDSPKQNRLVLHGQGVCRHTSNTPAFWRFLHRTKAELDELFDEVVFVGSADDREVAQQAYHGCQTFDDRGSFLELANYLNASRAMIGTGSACVALAQALKIPCVRVHDPIGEHPKVIWSGIGDNQVNDTEEELRKTWPTFRDTYLKGEPHGSESPDRGVRSPAP